MKLNVLTDYIAMNPEIKKIYIIGQDYSFGQVVSDTSIELLRENVRTLRLWAMSFINRTGQGLYSLRHENRFL